MSVPMPPPVETSSVAKQQNRYESYTNCKYSKVICHAMHRAMNAGAEHKRARTLGYAQGRNKIIRAHVIDEHEKP